MITHVGIPDHDKFRYPWTHGFHQSSKMKISSLAFACLLTSTNLVTCSEKVESTENIKEKYDEIDDIYIPTNLGHLSKLPEIFAFLANPYEVAPVLSRHTRNVFTKTVPMNVMVSERFNMPEILDYRDCDDELKMVLSLGHIENPTRLFMTLVEDVFKLDKFFKIKEPLVKYLARRYEKFSEEDKEDINLNTNALSLITNHMVQTSNYQWLAEHLLNDFNENIYKIHSWGIETSIEVFKIIFGNEANFERLVEVFDNSTYFVYSTAVFAFAVSLGAPDNFYLEELLDMSHVSFDMVISKAIECGLYLGERESMHKRISELLNLFESATLLRFMDKYEERMNTLNKLRIKNDVAFGHNDTGLYYHRIAPARLEHEYIVSLMIIAYSAGKMQLFEQLLNDGRNVSRRDFARMIQKTEYSNPESSSLKCLFHIHNLLSDEERAGLLNSHNYDYANFIFKYYEVVGYEAGANNTGRFSFKVLDEGLKYGLTNHLNLSMNRVVMTSFSKILDHFKVSDENVLHALLSHLFSILGININYFTLVNPSYEVVKLCLRSKKLRRFMRDSGLKLTIDHNVLSKLVKTYVNAKSLSVIAKPLDRKCIKYTLVHAKTDFELRNLEKITGHNIADLYMDFFDREMDAFNHSSDDSVAEEKMSDYFRVRHLLKYWLSSPHSERIGEISSQFYKDNLKIEFPKKTAQIFSSN